MAGEPGLGALGSATAPPDAVAVAALGEADALAPAAGVVLAAALLAEVAGAAALPDAEAAAEPDAEAEAEADAEAFAAGVASSGPWITGRNRS
jgi:hypothetical protein